MSLILVTEEMHNQITGFLNEERTDFLGDREMSAAGKLMYPGRAWTFDEASWDTYREHLQSKGLTDDDFETTRNTEEIFDNPDPV